MDDAGVNMSNLKDAPLDLQRPSTISAILRGPPSKAITNLPIETMTLVDACPLPTAKLLDAKTEKQP